MSNFRVLNNLLNRIRSDYQFDGSHAGYHSYLSVDPTTDWTAEEYEVFTYFMNERPLQFEEALELRGLVITRMVPVEIIFELSEEEAFDFSLTQGRTESQEEVNEKLVTISITMLIIVIIGFLASTLK